MQPTTIPYFIVMEFVAGWSLQEEIRKRGPVPLWYIKKWGSEIILGLKHLHTSNLLHRDLKSSNVMLKIVSKKVRCVASNRPMCPLRGVDMLLDTCMTPFKCTKAWGWGTRGLGWVLINLKAPLPYVSHATFGVPSLIAAPRRALRRSARQ